MIPPLRHHRGADAVRALTPHPTDAASVIAAALHAAGAAHVRVEIAPRPSRARPTARGRYLAGVITLFPAAFADPLALAGTVLHEAAHAGGADEMQADEMAANRLALEIPCSRS